MDKVRIVNWLLTRRCNLRCDYCAIVRDYVGKPPEYPDMKYYLENEMSTETIIEGLRRFKLHNPECFHILYGGEPLLRKDLSDIINYCNKEKIFYTIITNNSEQIQPLIEKLFSKVDYVEGLTSSVDPIIFDKNASGDIVLKSTSGVKELTKFKDYVKDLVAEVTVTNDTVQYLYKLVKDLDSREISSSITFIDIAKSPYYDFSNVQDQNLLVRPSAKLAEEFKKIFDDKLNVHMGRKLLEKIWDSLPSNMECNNCHNVRTLTVDSDGTLRLCLRVRGVETPNHVHLSNLFTKDNKLTPFLKWHMSTDTRYYCKKCNWTCALQSNIVDEDNSKIGDLIHLEKRRGKK